MLTFKKTEKKGERDFLNNPWKSKAVLADFFFLPVQIFPLANNTDIKKIRRKHNWLRTVLCPAYYWQDINIKFIPSFRLVGVKRRSQQYMFNVSEHTQKLVPRHPSAPVLRPSQPCPYVLHSRRHDVPGSLQEGCSDGSVALPAVEHLVSVTQTQTIPALKGFPVG